MTVKNTEATLELKSINVVYRGFSNPIYISKPNVMSFEASASGLRKKDSLGNDVLSPGTGKSVDIKIKWKLKNGDYLSQIKTLRIKDIGKPYRTINNFDCDTKCELKLKEELTNAIIDVKVNDFLHDNDFIVTSFKIKMHHYRTIEIVGDKMNIRANDLFTLLKPNDLIQIFNIRVRYQEVQSIG